MAQTTDMSAIEHAIWRAFNGSVQRVSIHHDVLLARDVFVLDGIKYEVGWNEPPVDAVRRIIHAHLAMLARIEQPDGYCEYLELPE